MAYEMVMPYHLHMPSYFLETFTEYPFLWASACITTLGSGDFTSWKKVSSKSFAF